MTMPRILAILLLAASLAAGDAPVLEPAALCTVRGGLPNVMAKVQAGKPVTVVWIGGSITVGGGGPKGHVTLVGEWLRTRFPGIQLTVKNAGISGTGSDYGAQRLDRDVLAHRPDLVLIEFAVNDGVSDRTPHMERMVRKAWTRDPATDLLIYYTVAQTHLDSYAAGKLPPSASAHERVAAHYGIPTISLGFEVQRRIAAGAMAWKDFSGDTCHPNATGYGIFTEVFTGALPGLLAAGTPGPHALPAAITPNLVLWPEPAKAQPLPAPAAMADSASRAALETWELPRAGVHWVGEPAFAGADGRPLWRLAWYDRAKASRKVAAADVPLDKGWDGNAMAWFEEARNFHGPSGTALFRDRGLSTGTRELGVLVFSAPAKGRYRVRVATTSIDLWQNDDMRVSLSLLHFGWGSATGRLLAHAIATKQDKRGVELEAELPMVPGEEIALMPNLDSGWLNATWAGLQVRVGRWAE